MKTSTEELGSRHILCLSPACAGRMQAEKSISGVRVIGAPLPTAESRRQEGADPAADCRPGRRPARLGRLSDIHLSNSVGWSPRRRAEARYVPPPERERNITGISVPRQPFRSPSAAYHRSRRAPGVALGCMRIGRHPCVARLRRAESGASIVGHLLEVWPICRHDVLVPANGRHWSSVRRNGWQPSIGFRRGCNGDRSGG
jgi:hypothetical protein